MKVGKPKSKRQPVRLRHKIEKASAAKHRKNRKLAKKDPTWRTRLKKDPGIPNLFPYKEKLLQEIEEKKRLKEEEARRKREELKALKTNGDPVDADVDGEDLDVDGEDAEELYDGESASDDEGDMDMVDDSKNPMAALLASAKARAVEYDQAGASLDAMDEDDEDDFGGFEDEVTYTTTSAAKGDSSRKAFDRIFKQVIESADVILYVLDARDPEGTRSREVERQILAADGGNKRLILILNKIDLVPPNVLKGWLTHLRKYFPTLPLRASMPAPNARTFDHKQLSVKGTSEALFKALKTYAQSKSLKRSISVGIIGYPNVGKSSVINALTSRMGKGAAAPVGAEAGVTTSLREVKLDNKLKLLDSPGIVFPTATGNKMTKSEEHARLILLNAVPPKDIEDPVPAVTLLLKRMSASQEMMDKLLNVYDLPPLMSTGGDITTDFLVQVARKRGRLGRGGIPNLHSAAQCVITDWRDGRIQGWADPPVRQVVTEDVDMNMDGVDHVKIVKEWAEEFKLEGLWGGAENGVDVSMES
ncbi:uncharacterized protein PV09_02507 [Verruconis gallopava]|uniref:CP-type G domain-containing protein n=1 Tax=Verruconis gallopava TaxID=253628 RepID=A0A0D1Z1M0_9PEZI|nr:uncharacterized protein PV09_02507 [Verruconis gallopava]KIW06827.1 hypothetical protein PV09_02507 [Verruconis gallopava]